jgi:hypothetical protein
VLTAETVAEKVTLVVLGAMVTEAGTITAVLLLLRLTIVPLLGAAALRITVHASVPAPVKDELIQEIALGTATPVPLKLTVVDELVDELLLIRIWPLVAPLTVGSNWTVREALCPGFRVKGKLIPEMEKPVPVMVAEFTVTAVVPIEERVRVCEARVFTATSPKAMFAVLNDRVGVEAITGAEALS